MNRSMMQDTPVVKDQPQPPDMADRTGRTLMELAQVREEAIELLTRLQRPPQNLRIQVGAVTVDITWGDEAPASDARPALARNHDIPPSEDTRDDAGTECLRSPAVGVFYHARELGAEPFVSVGSVIRPGQQIGIIEAMKLMIPVEADRAGRITAVVKGNGEPVEYDEPLFALEAQEA